MDKNRPKFDEIDFDDANAFYGQMQQKQQAPSNSKIPCQEENDDFELCKKVYGYNDAQCRCTSISDS